MSQLAPVLGDRELEDLSIRNAGEKETLRGSLAYIVSMSVCALCCPAAIVLLAVRMIYELPSFWQQGIELVLAVLFAACACATHIIFRTFADEEKHADDEEGGFVRVFDALMSLMTLGGCLVVAGAVLPMLLFWSMPFTSRLAALCLLLLIGVCGMWSLRCIRHSLRGVEAEDAEDIQEESK